MITVKHIGIKVDFVGHVSVPVVGSIATREKLVGSLSWSKRLPRGILNAELPDESLSESQPKTIGNIGQQCGVAKRSQSALLVSSWAGSGTGHMVQNLVGLP